MLRHVCGQRVSRVGRGQEGLNTDKHVANQQLRGPLFLQDVQADTADPQIWSTFG